MTVKAVQQFMLGSAMKNEKQARAVLSAMQASGYNGIELCGFMIRPVGLAVRLLTQAAGMPVGGGGKLNWPALVQEYGLQVVSVHEDLDTIEKDPAAIAEEASRLGTNTVVVTGMYNYDFGDEAAVRSLADRLNAAGKALAGSGIELLYHNHNCELRKVSPRKTAFDLLTETLDPCYVNFEFDSYWMTEGGADAAAMMRRLGSRMKLWHINDRGTRITGKAIMPILKTDSMELGYGNMDLDTLSAIAKENGIRAVILESHRNWVDKSPVRSLQLSAEYLNRTF